MNVRDLEKLVNSKERITLLKETIEVYEAIVGNLGGESDNLFDTFNRNVSLFRVYFNFVRALVLYSSSASVLNKYQDQLKEYTEKLEVICEKVTAEKAKREDATELERKTISDDKKSKAKIEEREEKIISAFKNDIQTIVRQELLIKPFKELIGRFGEQSSEVMTFAVALPRLGKVKTIQGIEAYLRKFSTWAKENITSLGMLSPYRRFILALKDFTANQAIMGELLDEKDKPTGEFFMFINRCMAPMVCKTAKEKIAKMKGAGESEEEIKKAQTALEEVEKINGLLQLLEVTSHLPKFRQELLEAKKAAHAACMDSAKELLKIIPAEEVRKKHINCIVELEDAVVDFPDDDEFSKVLSELKAQFKQHYPDEVLSLKKRKDPEEELSKKEKHRRDIRKETHLRNLAYAKKWLADPYAELKNKYRLEIEKMEYVVTDDQFGEKGAAKLLAELKAQCKVLYPEEEVPSVRKPRTMVREHTKKQSFTLEDAHRVRTLYEVRPLKIPAKVEEEQETQQEETPKAPRSSSEPRITRRASMAQLPRLLGSLFSPRKSSPRHAISPRDADKEEKKEPKGPDSKGQH